MNQKLQVSNFQQLMIRRYAATAYSLIMMQAVVGTIQFLAIVTGYRQFGIKAEPSDMHIDALSKATSSRLIFKLPDSILSSIMPQEGSPSSTPEMDIWYTYEPTIRKLYLEEKKTLKLTMYGAKLRDQLNLPKKLKRKDWPVPSSLVHLVFSVSQLIRCNTNAPPARRDAQDTTATSSSPYLQQLITIGFNITSTSELPNRSKHCWFEHSLFKFVGRELLAHFIEHFECELLTTSSRKQVQRIIGLLLPAEHNGKPDRLDQQIRQFLEHHQFPRHSAERIQLEYSNAQQFVSHSLGTCFYMDKALWTRLSLSGRIGGMHRYRPQSLAAWRYECLELLVKSCDPNRTILAIQDDTFSSFSFVLFSMGDFFNIRSENIEWGLELHQPSLEILLEHGANVDLPVPGLLFLDPAMEHFFEDNTLPYTRPSLLEQCFYYSKEMYYQLVPFSSRPARDIYGDQLCLAATMGLPSFRDYIASKPSADSTILGSILA
ncbi:hypothetical protein CHU98_g6284 [Xylaria longipes]|nr:hypothetical protein CHU98_g6284 [Xylaria longipes]